MKKNTGDQVRQSAIALVVASIFTFGFAIYLWQNTNNKSADKLFWAAIEQSLSTGGVTRTYKQASGTQIYSQVTRMNYGGSAQVDTTISIYDDSDQSKIVSQLLGTEEADYIRYLELGNPSSSLGDGIKNRWAKMPDGLGLVDSILGEALTNSPLPTGNFDYSTRQRLINLLKDSRVYTVEGFTAKGQEYDGRKTDVIAYSVDTNAFQAFLREYLLAFGFVDLADTVKQSSYSEPVKVQVAIHPASKQIVKISPKDINAAEAESFSSWGSHVREEAPDNPLDFSELQKKLQEVNE